MVVELLFSVYYDIPSRESCSVLYRLKKRHNMLVSNFFSLNFEVQESMKCLKRCGRLSINTRRICS